MSDGDWRVCPWCPPDDAEWPADAFRAAGGAWPEGKRPCNSCFEARYGKRRTRCTGCGKRMETRGQAAHPRCLTCRRAARDARRAEVAKRVAARERKRAMQRAEVERARVRNAERRADELRKKRARKRATQKTAGMIRFDGFRFQREAA